MHFLQVQQTQKNTSETLQAPCLPELVWCCCCFFFLFLLVHLFIKKPRNSWMVYICAADLATAQPACNKSHNNWVQLNSETGLEAAGKWTLQCFSLVAVCSVVYLSVMYFALIKWNFFISARISEYHNLCEQGNPGLFFFKYYFSFDFSVIKPIFQNRKLEHYEIPKKLYNHIILYSGDSTNHSVLLLHW